MGKALEKFAGIFTSDKLQETKHAEERKLEKNKLRDVANKEKDDNLAKKTGKTIGGAALAGAALGGLAESGSIKKRLASAGMTAAAGAAGGAGVSGIMSMVGKAKNDKISDARVSLSRDKDTNEKSKRKTYPKK